jgi:hypothetical protein
MTVAIAALLAVGLQPTAVDLLKQVRDHYLSLTTFSMRIEHQDSSGLFPGKYTQTMRWRSGGRFELLVTAQDKKKVPDFYADGKQVLWIRPGNRWTTGGLMPDKNTMPSWEVSAGPIVGWLQDTPSGKMFLDPPKEIPIRWHFGLHTTWHGQTVRELAARMAGRNDAAGFSLFLDDRRRLLVGMENRSNAKVGWEMYTDQKMNPPLPSGLGSAPVSKK